MNQIFLFVIWWPLFDLGMTLVADQTLNYIKNHTTPSVWLRRNSVGAVGFCVRIWAWLLRHNVHAVRFRARVQQTEHNSCVRMNVHAVRFSARVQRTEHNSCVRINVHAVSFSARVQRTEHNSCVTLRAAVSYILCTTRNERDLFPLQNRVK